MEKKRIARYALCFAALAILLAVLLGLNLFWGSVNLSFSEVISSLFGGEGTAVSIVRKIRLPRLLAATILGGALSVSGFLLQSFFANPIAGPFVLGISSGAKLVVALTLVFFLQRGIVLGSAGLILASFIGSMISMGFILLISGKVQRMSILIISGVMIGYICSAITDFVVTFADDSNIVNLHNWSMGSFSGTDWGDIFSMSIVIFPALIVAFLLSKPMSAYQLGENYAKTMGVNVKLFRAALVLLSGLLSACVTAFAGPISFVGIAVPHIVKNMLGTAKPILVIPASFLGGAVFCLGCDLIARTLFAPTELSISSVTALFGAPVVIWIMLSREKRSGKG
ncbi:MAG: FecCD family ABC transporter permease [Oscillospiraceae bacterium]